MTTSLIIESKDLYDKSKQKSITDINPNASTNEILDFSQTIINLTNNSYTKTTRIDKTELDNKSTTKRTIRVLRVTGMSSSPAINLTPNEQNIYTANIPLTSLSTSTPEITIWIASSSFNQENTTPDITSETVSLQTLTWRTNANTTGGWQNAWTATFKITRETQSFNIQINFAETESFQNLNMTFNINVTEE